MKELTIEEKAKSYDEALKRMKSWVRGEHPECFTEAKKAAEFIFPELKESEDEKIRKALIRFHKSTIDIDGIKGEDIIAWLEKQGEKKSAWSEEDDVVVKDVCDKLNRLSMTYVGNESIVCQEEIKWLKTLKQKVTWKPNEEQMRYLLKYAEQNNYDGTILTSLYNDLKKL